MRAPLPTPAPLTTTAASRRLCRGRFRGRRALSQTGAGVLTLASVETYTGPTAIGSNSTLVIGAAGQLGSGNYAGAITDNGTLTYASSAATDLVGSDFRDWRIEPKRRGLAYVGQREQL